MDTHPDITSSSDSDSECGLSEDSDPPSSLSSMGKALFLQSLPVSVYKRPKKLFILVSKCIRILFMHFVKNCNNMYT